MCQRAMADDPVVSCPPPRALTGVNQNLSDIGVGVGAARIHYSSGPDQQFIYTAGTALLSTVDSVFALARHPFTDTSLGAADVIVHWPTGSHQNALRTMKAFAMWPDTTTVVNTGGTKIFLAGIAPPDTTSAFQSWDLRTLGFDENGTLLFDNRLGNVSPTLPVSLAVVNSGSIAVGCTYTFGGVTGYYVRILAATTGQVSSSWFFDNSGRGNATLASLVYTGTNPVSLVAFGTGPGADGHTKFISATLTAADMEPVTYPLPTPGDNDGRDYVAADMSFYGAPSAENSFLAMTGTVVQGSGGLAPTTKHDYFTVAYVHADPSPQNMSGWDFMGSGLGMDTYDGAVHDDDVAVSVKNWAAVPPDGPGFYTWVTGQSSRDATNHYSDPVTILYNWNLGHGHAARLWVARRQEPGFEQTHASGAGAKVDLEPSSPALPIIYVLAKVQVEDANHVLRWNYEYLSYDDSPPNQNGYKPTRWEAPEGTLPAACYYASPNGDSLPSAFAIRKFVDEATGFSRYYMFRNGISYQGATTGYDILTTLERDQLRE